MAATSVFWLVTAAVAVDNRHARSEQMSIHRFLGHRLLAVLLLAAMAVGGLTLSRGLGSVQATASSQVIIGVVNGAGYGPASSAALRNAGIGSARDEGVSALQADLAAGFRNNSVIIGNTDDATPLNKVDIASWAQSAAAQVDQVPAGNVIEVGNEMYLKGNGWYNTGYPNGYADPVSYAKMFSALATLRPNAPLLFDAFGDYQRADGSWSQDAAGNGWLADALRAVPALKTQVKGFVSHPYGNVGDNSANDWGPGALVADHDYSVKLGYGNTDKWYLTEYGVNINGGSDCFNTSTQQGQADCLTKAFNFFLTLPYVRGIWWFQSRDYSGGNNWGVLNNDNSPRPSLAALAAFAKSSSASTPTPAPTVTATPTAAPTVTPTAKPTPVPTPAPASSPAPAFPAAPRVALDGHGGFYVSGSGDSYWHIAYSTNKTSGASGYSWPDIPAATTDYTPPSATPCISVQAVQGGTGHADGTDGTGWSGWVCE
jgi:hypothetical protein